jgi:hypothetical protein
LISVASSRENNVAPGSLLEVGDIVDVLVTVHSSGVSTHWGGSISAVNSDGTYAVVFDMGGIEPIVGESSIKLIQKANPAETGLDLPVYEEGDEVEITVGQTILPGRVRKANDDGTYAVDFDREQHKPRVYASYMKLIERAHLDERSSSPSFLAGHAVEVRNGLRPVYYGTIAKVNGDGTYGVLEDINYGDGAYHHLIGKYEARVRGSWMRLYEKLNPIPEDTLDPRRPIIRPKTSVVAFEPMKDLEKVILLVILVILIFSVRSFVFAKLNPTREIYTQVDVSPAPQEIDAYKRDS